MYKTNRVISILFSTVLILVMMCVPVYGTESLPEMQPVFNYGTGTAEDPYQIETEVQLQAINENLAAYYVLNNDIEVKKDFDTIDTFEGEFDGNGYYLSFQNIIPSGQYAGVFSVNNGKIKNLNISELQFEIESSDVYNAGILVGLNNGIIESCTVKNASITADKMSSSSGGTGGIAGKNSGQIKSCNNSSSVIGSENTGGLAGYNTGTISYSCNSGRISSEMALTGGIAGYSSGKISYCKNEGEISGNGSVGGIVGQARSNIAICGNTGDVDGYSNIGGIAGYLYESGKSIQQCYNTGNITAENGNAGGITGRSKGTVSNSFNTGSITYEWEDCGGIVGGNDDNAKIINCYNAGNVSQLLSGNSQQSGGITGTKSGIVNNSYSIMLTVAEPMCGEIYLSQSEMEKQSAYAGFDFDTVWTMDSNNGYPYPQLRNLALDAADVGADVSEYENGRGTSYDPFLITTKEQLASVEKYPWAYFRLENDLSFDEADYTEGGAFYNDGRGWDALCYPYHNSNSPIGSGFYGCFDGNGYTIKNIQSTVTKEEEGTGYFGLFGYNTGIIKNTGIENIHLSSVVKESYAYSGGVAGYNNGSISQCYVTGTIYSKRHAGGIAGDSCGRILNCYNVADIHSERNIYPYAGGITGWDSGIIENCYNSGDITIGPNKAMYPYVGGIVGETYGVVTNCYYTPLEKTTYSKGTMLTIEQMYSEDSFEGFDFDTIWYFADEGEGHYNYPQLNVFRPDTPETGHTEINAPAKEATCTETGLTEGRYCTVCDWKTGQQIIDAKGHDYKATELPPTCEEEGVTTYICECGDMYTEKIGALGHDWDEGETIKSPTCTEEGLIQYSCKHNPEHIRTEPVAALGHSYHEVVVEPGCEESGYVEYTCACGSIYGAPIKALGHDWNEGKVICEPTCEEDGRKLYTCRRNSEHAKVETVSAKGHNWVTDPAVEATCTQAGLTEGMHCSDCRKVMVEQTEIDKLDHNYGAYAVIKPAEFGENGIKTAACDECGNETSESITALKSPVLSNAVFTYNGKVKKPAVTVKNSNGTKISTANYDVKYASGRKNVGKYKVTVVMKGNYSGTKVLFFKINPKGASNIRVTCAKKSITVKWTKASANNRKQITGYKIRYSTSQKMVKPATITVKNSAANSRNITKLKAKKNYYVQVRTYKKIGNSYYYSDWSKVKKVRTK